MEVRLVNDEDEVALADRGTVEAVRAIEADVQFLRVALELITGQSIDLRPARIVQSLLSGHQDEPMVARKARRTGFPNLPLLQLHRSGSCGTLLMDDSRASRSSSKPYSSAK